MKYDAVLGAKTAPGRTARTLTYSKASRVIFRHSGLRDSSYVFILNVFMVITSTIYVHHRLHFVRINALRAFGMHALNAFLSYNVVCERHDITSSLP